MLRNLRELLPTAAESDGAIPCFNVFGYEDASAVVAAAERLQLPVILAANKDCVEYMGVEVIAALLRTVAERASVPIVVHLDHCYEEATIEAAIAAGFTSVMFDGSQLPLEDNIRRSRAMADMAHAAGVSIEGEIGSVAYLSGRDHIREIYTEPAEAQAFAEQSGVDAVAISIGNVHRLEAPGCEIQFDRLAEIEAVVKQPLVLHGVTGIAEDDLRRLRGTRIAKCNVGTSLRMAFGHGLRRVMAENPDEYDRLNLFRQLAPELEAEAASKLQLLAGH